MSRFIRSAAVLTLSASTLASLSAMAADELHYNQISLRTRRDDDESRGDGFGSDAASRGRYQPGQHERRWSDRSLAVTVAIHKNGPA